VGLQETTKLPNDTVTAPSNQQLLLGTLMLIMALVLYTINGELYVSSGCGAYLNVWFGHCLMGLCCPTLSGWWWLTREKEGRTLQDFSEWVGMPLEEGGENPRELPQRWRRVFLYSLLLAFIYQLQNWLWVLALAYSQTAIVNAIANCACVVVYLFSVLWLGEKILLAKIVGILVCVVGVALFAAASPPSQESGNTGYYIVFASMLLTALFRVTMKRLLGDCSMLFTVFFSGLLGISHMSVLWLGLPLLGLAGVEPFMLPDMSGLLRMLLNGSLAFAVNVLMFCINIAISPLFLSAGHTDTC